LKHRHWLLGRIFVEIPPASVHRISIARFCVGGRRFRDSGPPRISTRTGGGPRRSAQHVPQAAQREEVARRSHELRLAANGRGGGVARARAATRDDVVRHASSVRAVVIDVLERARAVAAVARQCRQVLPRHALGVQRATCAASAQHHHHHHRHHHRRRF